MFLLTVTTKLPVQFFGPEQKSLAIIVMAVLNFLVGWFNGMGTG